MTTINVSKATTAALLAFYNEHAATPVKRFSDRAAAERRVTALIAEMKPARKSAKAAYVVGVCPACGGTEDITCGQVIEVGRVGHKEQRVINEHIALHHGCGHTFNYETGRAVAQAGGTSSEAIAKSWNNPEVREARSARNKVTVDGIEYNSVRHAFVELGLPVSKHIAFRGQLKASGKLAFQGRVFKLVK